MKYTILFTATTLLTTAFAIPPACLLHGVNTQDNPADLSAICGTGANNVQSYLYDNCGDNHQDIAQKAFIETCSSAGTSVAAYTPTATSNGGKATGTASGTRSGSAATNTNAANSKSRNGMAAAAIALVGAVAAL